uniref:Uncharacterized protein n=1 Tax=Arundo donax TaxID=35708 RepID=A0A0A9BMV4_ARUDO
MIGARSWGRLSVQAV